MEPWHIDIPFAQVPRRGSEVIEQEDEPGAELLRSKFSSTLVGAGSAEYWVWETCIVSRTSEAMAELEQI